MKSMTAALSALALMLLASTAHAQINVSGQPGPGGQVPDANQNPPVKPQSDALQPASIPLLGGLADAAHYLYTQDGILIKGVLNDDLQGNVTGGLRRGYDNGGGYSLGADWDTRKVFGDDGGQVHVQFTQFYGKTIQHNIGNAIKSEGWYYPVEHFNLSQFAYEQNLFDGKLNLYGGRVNATAPFARPTYGCSFISGSQCPSYLQLMTGGFTSFPYVTWGGRFRYTPVDKVYIQSGAYEIDPRRRTEEGFNFSLNGATGYVLPVEVGYGTDFNNDKYPRHFKLGGWYNSAPYTDPLLNTAGNSRALVGGTAKSYQGGRGGLYALADQVIYRPNDGSLRNLAVFTSTSEPLDERETFQSQSTAGVFWTGPIAERPFDTWGVMMTYIVFTGRETEYMNQLLEKAGSPGGINRDEVNLEMNYGYRLTRGVFIYPNFEYIINPDISMRLNAKTAPGDAAVFGVRLSVNLGDVLGLPASILPSHGLP